MMQPKESGLNLFITLFKEIENIHKPIQKYFMRNLDWAYKTLTDEIFDAIANNNQKQAAKELTAIRRELIKLQQITAVDLIIKFDPEWPGLRKQEKDSLPDQFRSGMVYLVMDRLDIVIEFLVNYKSIPRIPKKI
jgi:hypothetical protein